jgi:hypothetical protein
VSATHVAAIDEVEHARLTYALASAYGGSTRGPGALVTSSALEVGSLAELASETFVDGCAGEATAALVLREAAAVAKDPAVRAMLERIADDEERHAELAWRTVAWALETGGADVARAIERAVANLACEASADTETDGAASIDLSAHGAFGQAAQRSVRRRAIAEVVLPCATALLAHAASNVAEA